VAMAFLGIFHKHRQLSIAPLSTCSAASEASKRLSLCQPFAAVRRTLLVLSGQSSRTRVCPLLEDGHSGEAAGQLHDFANAGGVEIVDAPGEPDDAFGRSRLKSCRQTVANLDEMLLLADRRRAPLAARTIAARLEDASAVELDPKQHIHLLETAGDRGVEAELELRSALAAARDRAAEYDIAATVDALDALGRAPAGLVRERDEILGRLKVQQLPTPSLG